MVYSVRNRLNYNGSRQSEVRGEFVTYTRAGYPSISIRQCPGHTDIQDLIPENVVTVGRYVDFIFSTNDLNIAGLGQTLPVRGDKVVWENRTYTVTAPAAADDVYNFTTMYKDRLRVHTILTT